MVGKVALTDLSTLFGFDYLVTRMSTTAEETSKLSTTGQNEYLALGEVQRTDVPWYRPSLPQPLQPHIQHLFEAYVGLAPDEIISHIESVI